MDRPELLAFADARRDRFEALLSAFVRRRTVSADPASRTEMGRLADEAAAAIAEQGGDAEVVPTPGNPIVFGSFGARDSRPTVTLYNHLDVQPASREEEGWRTDPFELAIEGDRYFGRGATDDKGPALCALLGAAAARAHGVDLNVRLLWEFEEEIGSPHLEAGLDRLGDRLASDCVVVSDTAWLSRDRPASEAGLRGFQGFRLSLRTAGSDRHSGDVGGAARNAVAEIAELVASMHDAATGRVTIPGFYDDVVPPCPEELAGFEASGFRLDAFRADNELTTIRSEDRIDVMRRIWAEPTLEVHGIAGGYAGPGMKAIVPGRAEATISCRLVPDQRPEKIADLVVRFVRDRNHDVVVEPMAGAPPFRGVTTGPHAEALVDAYRFAFGMEPAFVRSGGTIGAVTTLSERLRCPILFLGISLPEHGYHAPNENFDWAQARGGIAAFARLLDRLARITG